MSGKLRIIPLGGYGEVGRNMTVLEYDGDIIVVDCGLMFPESDMLGVDLVVPNFNYLAENVDRVLGYLITHGHEDHHGALPYVLPHAPAPIFATRLTRGLIEVRLKEHRLLGSAEITTIAAGQPFDLGPFHIEAFRAAHSIPDAVGFAIDTPIGLVVHTGEYKFDLTPVTGTGRLHALASAVAAASGLLADSTNAERRPAPSGSVVPRPSSGSSGPRADHRRDLRLEHLAGAEVINVAEEFERKVGWRPVDGELHRDGAPAGLPARRGGDPHAAAGAGCAAGQAGGDLLHGYPGRADIGPGAHGQRRPPRHHAQARRHRGAFGLAHPGQRGAGPPHPEQPVPPRLPRALPGHHAGARVGAR
jgi:hypothetical protein